MRSPAVPAECVRRRRTAVVRRQTHRSWGCRLSVRSRQHRKRSPAIMGARGAGGQLIDPAWWQCCQRRAQRGCCLAKARQPHRLQPQIPGAATTGRNFARSSLPLSRVALLVGRQRLPALALGAGIGGREVCLLAAIVAEPCAKAAAPEKANSKPAGQHRDIKMGRCRRWETAREGAIRALAQLISVPKTSNDRSLRRAASKSALTAFAHRQPCATGRIAASSGAYARLSVNRGRP